MAWLKSGDRKPFSELIAVRGDILCYFEGTGYQEMLETTDSEEEEQ